MRSFFLTVIVAASLHGAQSAAMAQPKLDSPAAIPQYMDLMKRPAIQKDLEMANSQVDDLEKISTRRKAMIGFVGTRIEQMSVEERPKAIKQLQEDMAAIEIEAFNLLLPFQKMRIDQIKNQITVRASEPTAGLTHHRMVSALSLSENQLKLIRERGAEVDAKLQEKIDNLRKQIEEEKAKARREVLSVLTDEQRKSYYAAVGEIVDLSQLK